MSGEHLDEGEAIAIAMDLFDLAGASENFPREYLTDLTKGVRPGEVAKIQALLLSPARLREAIAHLQCCEGCKAFTAAKLRRLCEIAETSPEAVLVRLNELVAQQNASPLSH